MCLAFHIGGLISLSNVGFLFWVHHPCPTQSRLWVKHLNAKSLAGRRLQDTVEDRGYSDIEWSQHRSLVRPVISVVNQISVSLRAAGYQRTFTFPNSRWAGTYQSSILCWLRVASGSVHSQAMLVCPMWKKACFPGQKALGGHKAFTVLVSQY